MPRVNGGELGGHDPRRTLRKRCCPWRLHPQIPKKSNPGGIEFERNAIRIRTAKQAFMRVCAILQGRLSSKSFWHMARTPAVQQALSNAWLKAQGLVSVKDLWCKAQGYAT